MMKTKLLLTSLAFGMAISLQAQNRLYTKTAVISFNAGTALEDIDAVNKSVASVIDVASGRIEMAALIKGFEFRRGLMQEHFNENYMESEKFPKAVFKGTIDQVTTIDFKKDGTYHSSVKGSLEIHGVKKEVEIAIAITIANGKVSASTTFRVSLDDFQIRIPTAVKDKISSTVSIQVMADYKSL